MNDKIRAALGGSRDSVSVAGIKPEETASAPEVSEEDMPEKRFPNIVTTEEELKAYFIMKSILSSTADVHVITCKDTESHINILYKANSRKRICRLHLTDSQKTLIVPVEHKSEMKYQLQDIYKLTRHKDTLKIVLQRYL